MVHLTTSSSRRLAWIALPAAVLASAAVIGTASYSAFSATTDNTGNSWSTGHVALSDDDQGVAMFDVDGLVPGSTGSKDIEITADTSVATDVTMYAKDVAGSIGNDLHLTIEQGTGTGAGFTAESPVFDGTLTEFAAATGFANGHAVWSPAEGTDTRTVRVSYELADDATNTAQDQESSAAFVWEAQSR